MSIMYSAVPLSLVTIIECYILEYVTHCVTVEVDVLGRTLTADWLIALNQFLFHFQFCFVPFLFLCYCVFVFSPSSCMAEPLLPPEPVG